MTRFKFYYSCFVAAVLLAICVDSAHCQTPVVLAPPPELQFFDQNGVPLAFGCVFTYESQTTTPLATFTDLTGTVQNANPVILDASGFPSNGSSIVGIWMQAGLAYTFRVKAAGGTNCASGSTLYTVDGIGGGISTLTTIIPYSSTVTFVDASQNQLFELTLTGNATSNPLTAVGITPPGIVTFQITQDSGGGHTFGWPSNTVGGVTICAIADCTTQQSFIWNGTDAIAIGAATFSSGPAQAVVDLYDFGLSATSSVCTDANKKLVSGGSCSAVLGVTYNGQTVGPGGSGNVNAGAAAHSVALNQGNGNALTGLALGADQTPIGAASADPVASSTIPSCADSGGQHLNYATGGTFSCGTSSAGAGVVQASSITLPGGTVSVSDSTLTTLVSKAVTMPASGCPCRVSVSYGIRWTNMNSGVVDAYVTDATDIFASRELGLSGSFNDGTGMGGSSFSTSTYANAATPTFTLKMEQNTGATITVQNGPRLVGQGTYLNVTIFTSQ